MNHKWGDGSTSELMHAKCLHFNQWIYFSFFFLTSETDTIPMCSSCLFAHDDLGAAGWQFSVSLSCFLILFPQNKTDFFFFFFVWVISTWEVELMHFLHPMLAYCSIHKWEENICPSQMLACTDDVCGWCSQNAIKAVSNIALGREWAPFGTLGDS